LKVLLVGKAIVELEEEGGRDGPGVADTEEIAYECLVGSVRTEGIVKEAVLVVVVYVPRAAHESPLAGGKVVVDAEVELVFRVDAVACIAVVISNAGSVGRRHDLQKFGGDRVDVWDVASSGIAGAAVAGSGDGLAGGGGADCGDVVRVVDERGCFGKDALPHEGGRDGGGGEGAGGVTCTLVAEGEEGAVFAGVDLRDCDWTAYKSAELVEAMRQTEVVAGGDGVDAGGFGEVVGGVELVVTEELVDNRREAGWSRSW
jgi:hypothetical protein